MFKYSFLPKISLERHFFATKKIAKIYFNTKERTKGEIFFSDLNYPQVFQMRETAMIA